MLGPLRYGVPKGSVIGPLRYGVPQGSVLGPLRYGVPQGSVLGPLRYGVPQGSVLGPLRYGVPQGSVLGPLRYGVPQGSVIGPLRYGVPQGSVIGPLRYGVPQGSVLGPLRYGVPQGSVLGPLRYGVPQGSVLGPLLFTVYTAPMVLKRHVVEYHKFADDLQIYTSYYPHVPDDRERATQRLSDCINEIKCWMVQHKLKLNDEKTEFMVALSPHHQRTLGLPKNLMVGGATIKPVVSVRNLGAHFDTTMSKPHNVYAVCKKCNSHLRRIKSIRPHITKRVCHSLVIALVVSSLDYCNALLLEISLDPPPEDTQ